MYCVCGSCWRGNKKVEYCCNECEMADLKDTIILLKAQIIQLQKLQKTQFTLDEREYLNYKSKESKR